MTVYSTMKCCSLSSNPAAINTPSSLTTTPPFNNLYIFQAAAQAPSLVQPRADATHPSPPKLKHSDCWSSSWFECVQTWARSGRREWNFKVIEVYWFRERQKLSREIYLGLGRELQLVERLYWCMARVKRPAFRGSFLSQRLNNRQGISISGG